MSIIRNSQHKVLVKPSEVDDAWKGKFAKPAPNKIFEIILATLKRNGEIYRDLVAPQLGIDIRSVGPILGSMVKQNLIKEVCTRRINGKKVQIYMAYDAKYTHPERAQPDPVIKTDETISIIEDYVDEGEEVYIAQMMHRLDEKRTYMENVFAKMVRLKIIAVSGKRIIDGNWHTMYRAYKHKPRQASMFANVTRDALVAAFFGDYTPPEGAAWAF